MSEDGSRVLLIRRDKRPGDLHFGKYNGLGGKLEAHEDVVAGIRREIHEESGLECVQLVLRGTISWPGFGKNGEDWFVFLFRIDRYRGQARAENEEGTLVWAGLDELSTLPFWEGDRHFLAKVFERNGRMFHGVMPYRNGVPLRWSCTELEADGSWAEVDC